MRCGKKQCYLESLWTFRYNKDIASEKTLKSGEKKGVTMDIIAKISEEAQESVKIRLKQP